MCRPLSEQGLAPDRIGIRFGLYVETTSGLYQQIGPVRPMRAIIVKSNVEHKFVEKPKEEEIKEIVVDDFGF